MLQAKKYIALIIIGLVSAFGIGYWQGQESVLLTLSKQQIQLLDVNRTFEPGKEANKRAWITPTKNTDKSSSNNLLKANEYLPSIVLPAPSIVADSNSPIDLLEYLVLITASDNPQDMEQFSITMDRLRKLVSTNPANVEILLDYFIASPVDSRQPYYIISVLQSADIPDRKEVLANLVQRLSFEGSVESDQKMLQLVSNTGLVNENAEVIKAVKDIALYSSSSKANRLFALDLLMPYQLDVTQKQKVVDDLRFALNTSKDDDKSYLVENIMRYSDKDQRQEMASNFLKAENDFASRVAILSSIHSGSVQASDTLKSELLSIAQNPSDPLREHAKHALMYAFEIDNSEYQLLFNSQ